MTIFDPYSYQLNGYALPMLFSGALIVFLGVFTLTREKQLPVSATFLLVCASLGVYQFATGMGYMCRDDSLSLVWARISQVGTVFIPATVLMLSLARMGRLGRRRALCAGLILLSTFFAIAALATDLHVKGVARFFWGNYVQYGPVGFLFLLYFAPAMFYVLHLSLEECRQSIAPRDRKRAKGLLTAFGVAYIASVDFLPAFGIGVYPFGYLPLTIFTFIGAFVSLRYHLVEITPELAAAKILETMRGGVLVTDSGGAIRVANQAVGTMLGLPKKALIGKRIATVLPLPADMEATISSGERGVSGELRFPGGSGVAIEAAISVSPLKDSDDTPVGAVCVLHDLTDRVQAEEALKTSERRFAQLIGNSFDAIVILDAEGIQRYVSPSAEKVHGYSTAELVDIPVIERMIHPEDQERVKSAFLAILATGTGGAQYRHRRKGGGWVHLEAKGTNQLDNPDIRGVLVNVRDITERVEMETKLRQSEARLIRSQEISRTGTWEIDHTGGTLLWSDEAYSIFEVEKSTSAIGYQTFLSLIHPEDRELVDQAYREAVKNRTRYSIDHRLLFADGRVAWVHEEAETTYDPEGNPLISLGTVQDITERLRLENERILLKERLAQSQKMEAIGTLAGGIAHDFNNLLAAIMGYTELSMIGLPAESEVRNQLQVVMTASERAKALVEQILAFSRRGDKKLATVDAERIVKETLKLLAEIIPKTITIEQELKPDAGYVLADPTELHQVVMNLCTNAFQSMHSGQGLLRVRLSDIKVDTLLSSTLQGLPQGEYILLEVVDNGPGIAPEVLPKIFEPYFTTKDRGKGTGLGLALVQSIVSSIGGTIRVQSAPGVGTAFTVYLPKAEPEATEELEEREAASLCGKGSVMVVDDEPALAELSALMLEALGYTVRIFTDPLQAIRAFERDPTGFDVIVTDQTMPGLTGANLLRKAKEIRPGMPAVICTGYSEQIDEAGAKRMGIAAYVQKPYDMKRLGRGVAAALGKG